VPYDSSISDVPGKPNAGSVPDDDTHAVAAARDGDRAALESLLRRHYDRCYAICRRLLGNDQDALDATQEAMIAIARSIGSFNGRSSFSTWTYRVATNAALDELRRRRRRPLVDSSIGAGERVTTLDQWPDSARPDEVGDSVAARLSLDQALEQVSEEHRVAVVLRDMLDLEYGAIAEVLRVPIGTVRSRIARGRLALAQALEAGRPASTGADRAPEPSGNRDRPGGVQARGPRL
jgi:RNA polymerase sigma-70 factor (ECF subfamily)